MFRGGSGATGDITVTSVTSPTIKVGTSSDLFLTRAAANQMLISGDGVGAAGANQGWIIGTAANNISGIWSSAIAGAWNTANASLYVDNSGTTGVNAKTGQTVTLGINGSAVLTCSATGVANAGYYSTAVPVTETNATHTVATTTSHLICNRAGTITVTLPTASSFPGRQLWIRTIQAQAVDSNASNVIPRIGGSAGTAILGASDGAWAFLVSNGTAWEIMAGS